MSWGGGSWGVWHTGPAVPGPCPQDAQWHSIDDAVSLNTRENEYRQAVMHARNKEWLGAERKR